jgi:SIR2-like domain
VAQSYDELEWHILRLRHAREAGKLVFLLGAGVNTEYDLPNWRQMLIRLTEGCGRLHAPQHALSEQESGAFINQVIIDPLMQAASLRAAYASPADWVRALKRVLAFDKNVLDDEAKPLGRIAKVVGDQYRKDPQRHVAVLTFNYDSLIVNALQREMGTDADVVISVSTGNELARVRHRPGIFVYQLHGSLENEKSDIVLDAYSYVRILAAPANHWSWSCMNTFLFQKDAGVMFIGLSLVDPSLRLLLTHAAENGMPLSAIFVGDPLDAPILDPLPKALTAAWMKHDVQRLFDSLLEELSLIPYHVTEWSEVGELIDRVGAEDD